MYIHPVCVSVMNYLIPSTQPPPQALLGCSFQCFDLDLLLVMKLTQSQGSSYSPSLWGHGLMMTVVRCLRTMVSCFFLFYCLWQVGNLSSTWYFMGSGLHPQFSCLPCWGILVATALCSQSSTFTLYLFTLYFKLYFIVFSLLLDFKYWKQWLSHSSFCFST